MTALPAGEMLGDTQCPKCGAKMEPIESGVEGPVLQHLQLCPSCYLVVWNDPEGIHVRQGIPMKKGVQPSATPKGFADDPEEC